MVNIDLFKIKIIFFSADFMENFGSSTFLVDRFENKTDRENLITGPCVRKDHCIASCVIKNNVQSEKRW